VGERLSDWAKGRSNPRRSSRQPTSAVAILRKRGEFAPIICPTEYLIHLVHGENPDLGQARWRQA
jgi:hypothetical protein